MPETTAHRTDASTHGRFNLEQQRKRAKELLKAVRSHHPEAITRVTRHLSLREQPLRLADAQLVIAREWGFASWPRLKAHVEALDFARRQAGMAGDRDARTLHIRCGSDIRHSLRTAGFTGDFLEFSDPFCIGPVPACSDEELIRVRAHFLAGAFDMAEQDSLARLRKSYAALELLDNYERLVLWFEHDSYDQLILAYLLHRLNLLRPSVRIELIAVDAVPGVSFFIGIGQLSPDVLAWLWTQRKQVTDAQLQLGSQAWSAITDSKPESLMTLVESGTPALPMMAWALRRHLHELPALDTGLGLSEQLILTILHENGPLPAGKVYAFLMGRHEPLPYLGDLMFWWLLHPLITAPAPVVRVVGANEAVWPQRVIGLTELGERVLRGEVSWLAHMPVDRWVGGVRIGRS